MRILGLLAAVVVTLASTGCSLLRSAHIDDATACRASVDRGVLPDWALAGFSSPDVRVPHVIGRSGDILGVLFGDPLTAPADPGRNNKILWVARGISAPSDLGISAQRMDGTELIGFPVERSVPGGPGPSIIDLPDPGCWRLGLTWGQATDSLDLEYISLPGQPG